MRRFVVQVLSLGLLMLGVGTLTVGPASAHTVLKSSNPSAGQVLRQAPDTIELAFNEELRANTSQVAVTVGDTAPIEVEIEATVDTLTADLTGVSLPEVAEGERTPWKIGYRIVSTDGHPVSGIVEFVVDRTLLVSSPAEGDVLSSVPPAIDLTFGRDISSVDVVAVTVGDAAEQQVTAAAGGNRVQVPLGTVDVPQTDGAQPWRIGYRVVDAGGEVLTGLLSFSVDVANGTAPVTPEELSEPPAAAATPSSAGTEAPDPLTSTADGTGSTTGSAPGTATSPSAAAGSVDPSGTGGAPITGDQDPAEPSAGSGTLWWVVLAVVVLAVAGGVVVWRRRSGGPRAS